MALRIRPPKKANPIAMMRLMLAGADCCGGPDDVAEIETD